MPGCSTTFTARIPCLPRVAGMGKAGHLATRRWFYLIPATGEPRALVHAIERYNLDHLPGAKTVYAGREQLESGLGQILNGVKRVAMEYSPRAAIPYVSRVDARHHRTGPRARRRRRVVRRSRSSSSKRAGTTRRLRLIARRRRRCIASRIARSSGGAAAARRGADDRVRHSAADGGLVQGRRPRR